MFNNLLVIIVTYNAMPWIEKCIGSVLDSTVAADIILIDNGSSDGTQEYVKQNFPAIIFIQSEENLGFGKANNIGFRYALKKGYEYVYLLNQDAWIFPDTFKNLIQIHQLNPDYGILSPIQMQANMRYMDHNFGLKVCFQIKENEFISDLYTNSVKDVYEVPVVMAAHWLISKKCLEIVGGFSPSFPHYGEDDNWCHRANYWGFKIGIVPAAKGVHDRENRVMTIKYQIYMFYIGLIRSISNPLMSGKYFILRMVKDCMLHIFKTNNISPLIYLCKFLYHLKYFKENKAISMISHCAFLK
jgi:GT2 family glycosyltransferase